MEWFLKVVRDNYANFNGRARRKEYWMFILVFMLGYIGLFIVASILSAISHMLGALIYGLISLACLAILVPALAVTVRRLHDVGKPTWYVILSFIPIVSLYILYLTVLEGDKGENEFGPDPKAGENADPFAGSRSDVFPGNNPE